MQILSSDLSQIQSALELAQDVINSLISNQEIAITPQRALNIIHNAIEEIKYPS